MLVAFGKGDNSWRAFEQLRYALHKAGRQFTRTVSFRSGHFDEKEVTWHAREHVWSLLDSSEAKNRFWCCFGLQNPKDVRSLGIVVEVNPRLEGTDLRVAGAFARDAQGTIHLCHNGRIGGGRHGVGKAAFFKHYRGDLTAMAHEERTISVVDLGPVRSPRLPARLGRFAREVLRVKRLITAPEKHSYAGPIATRQVLARKSKGFVPEFADFRTPYPLQDEVEAQAEHGLVVDALVESVEKLGYATQNDQMRGLYILDDNHRLMVLFEVKTDITRTSIYAAVGQLLLNGRIADEETRMVLVAPGTPDSTSHAVLTSIGIDVLPYKWKDNEPVFPIFELERLMN